jgi:hypothetical protein
MQVEDGFFIVKPRTETFARRVGMWWLLVWIVGAGAVGGIVNALITDQGFKLPGRDKVDTITIYRPGWIGNVIIGAIAAGVSWGLYGPLAAHYIAGTPEALQANATPEKIGVALSSLVGAVLVGVGGARWLSNEVDKTVLKVVASKLAGAQPTPSLAHRIAFASPSEALEIAKRL